jgi:glycosyltransferase involved in cell wall biosynthesis
MRILQIISKNDRYGAQRVFLDQVKILHRMGNAVFVVTRGTEGYVTDSARAMGIPCYGIPMKGLKDIFFLRNFVKEYKIDVIHTSLDRADYFGLLLSLLTRRPVISTMHVRRYHSALRFATAVIVSSHVQERTLKAKGIKPKNIHLIRPGVDVERFKDPDAEKRALWERKLGIKKYSIIFCHIASLHSPKAHIVSLDLTAECKKSGENPLLIIVGGPLKEEYQEFLLTKIDELGLNDNVRFTDWTQDVPELLSLSHFTVLPSRNEALGMVLLEGMVAGRPIIAREGEGGAELVQEYGTGFLYKPEEGVRPLAKNVIMVRRDSAQYRVLSGRCRNIAEKEFSLARFGERLVDLYSSVLRKSKITLFLRN